MIIVKIPHLLTVFEVGIRSCLCSIATFVVAILARRVVSINDQEVSNHQIFFISHYYDISIAYLVIRWTIDKLDHEHYSERLAHSCEGIVSASYLLVYFVIHTASYL